MARSARKSPLDGSSLAAAALAFIAFGIGPPGLRSEASGAVEFLRGDANADGAADVSDAVSLLGALFLGAADVPCEDGADADDNGLLEITDAVVLRGALFLGEGPLPPPYRSCGPGLTGDGLGCRTTGCGN